ncbi:ferric reductase-like transmembrane domain-containing protein [Microbulbifer pacificus]|uniref:ferric reductase-like transmembrane domain-containing protein n=1 Tax=Microbulbifer pacificus TaxID=407164 RepID=UPI000CF3A6BE|nr:ferric reductase-like transmembrane domain-containing protein [Microbulbifer pacificus]
MFAAFFSRYRLKRRARKAFFALAGTDKLIDFREWQAALGLKNPLVARRLFAAIDTDGSGYIDEDEYCEFVATLKDRHSPHRYQLLFDIYDLNDDGALNQKTMREVLAASLGEQSLQVSDDDLAELARCFLSAFPSQRRHTVNKAEFVAAIADFHNTDSLFERFAQTWIGGRADSSAPATQSAPELSIGPGRRLSHLLQMHGKTLFWASLYLLANGLLFAHAASEYAARGAGTAIQIARSAGACLNFNLALILLPICRSLWTWLRHTWVAHLLPIDSLIDMHRTVGYTIVLFTLVHLAAHTFNYWGEGLLTPDLLQDSAFATGAISLGLLALMLRGIAARHSRQRERFTSSHLLYAGFIIAILLHGPVFWAWLAVPAGLFFLDALYRAFIKTRRVEVLSVRPLADGVTAVRFAKPRDFRFFPGDYLRLRVPAISRWEWHPFTISAAPEAGYFDVHIRNNGDWSGALHNLSRKQDLQQQLENNGLRAQIDGPYGAPTSSIYRAPVAVMVAAGIGVTPFASALESLVMRHEAEDKNRPRQIVYFHWLNRSQRSYEWFQHLLANAETRLGDNFRLHIHLTSLSHNLTNIAMQIAADAFYRKHQRDPFTQLQAVTSPGRPDWQALFAGLAGKHAGQKVVVYYCGPVPLAKELQRHCRNFGFGFCRERFD